MAETWPGIVVRCSTNEGGTVPRSATADSPDIILAGSSPWEDPSVLLDAKNYGNPYSNSLYIGFPNYIYLRGKNFTGSKLTGNWNLFWATPNILLLPFLWQKNKLATSTGDKNPALSIDPGKIGASLDPFTWVPPDTSDHYCMIGLASTPGHGNPVEGVNNISQLAEVLATNANIAQRNVHMVRGTPPDMLEQAGYDQGDEAAKVDLAVVFKNIPLGSNYTVSSGTPLNGKALSHAENNTKDNSFKFAWTDLEIPAKWNTVFTWTLKLGSNWSGIPKGEHPSVEIRGELVQNSKQRLYHLGYDAGYHPGTSIIRVDEHGGPVRVLKAGSVTTIMPDFITR
jgi:hypothetical protein